MAEKKNEQTITVPNATDEDGNQGTLTVTIKAGGNAHAEFEPAENYADAGSEPHPDQSLPEQPDDETSDAT